MAFSRTGGVLFVGVAFNGIPAALVCHQEEDSQHLTLRVQVQNARYLPNRITAPQSFQESLSNESASSHLGIRITYGLGDSRHLRTIGSSGS